MPPPPSWRTPARAGAARGRSLPGPGLPRAGPAFVFASPAVAAHPGQEPPGAARPVQPGLDRLARPSGPGRGAARPLAAARSDEDRDRIWARRLEWVVDQHLSRDRAEYEQNQLQRDFKFEAVLRQSKEARERKYDQTTISYLSKQLDTTRETIWALRR